jgi:hypothetical protein
MLYTSLPPILKTAGLRFIAPNNLILFLRKKWGVNIDQINTFFWQFWQFVEIVTTNQFVGYILTHAQFSVTLANQTIGLGTQHGFSQVLGTMTLFLFWVRGFTRAPCLP